MLVVFHRRRNGPRRWRCSLPGGTDGQRSLPVGFCSLPLLGRQLLHRWLWLVRTGTTRAAGSAEREFFSTSG